MFNYMHDLMHVMDFIGWMQARIKSWLRQVESIL